MNRQGGASELVENAADGGTEPTEWTARTGAVVHPDLVEVLPTPGTAPGPARSAVHHGAPHRARAA